MSLNSLKQRSCQIHFCMTQHTGIKMLQFQVKMHQRCSIRQNYEAWFSSLCRSQNSGMLVSERTYNYNDRVTQGPQFCCRIVKWTAA